MRCGGTRGGYAATVLVLTLAAGCGSTPARVGPTPNPAPSATTDPEPTATAEPTAEPTAADPTPSPIAMPRGCDEVLAFPYAGPPHAGAALPKGLVLNAAAWGRCYALVHDVAGYPVWRTGAGPGPYPDACRDNAPYPSDSRRVAGRFRLFQGGPEVGGFTAVARYDRGGAGAFLAEVRERVARCATVAASDGIGPWHSRVVESGFAGAESLLVYVGTSATGAGYPGWYVGVVRVGDLVAVVEPHMDLGGDRSFTRAMTRKAADRLG